MNQHDGIGTKRKQMTNDQLGELIERIENNDYKRTNWYPSMQDAEEIAADPVGNYEFMIWILYSNPDAELTEEEKQVEKYLEALLHKTTKITDSKRAG